MLASMRELPPTIAQRGISVSDETTCPVCKADLATEPHRIDPHRKAAGLDRKPEDEPYRLTDEDNRYIEKAMRRHPAGNRLRGMHRPERPSAD